MTNTLLQEQQQLAEVAAGVRKLIEQSEVDTYDFHLTSGQGFDLQVREQRLEKIERFHSRNLSITLYCGQRLGHVAISDFTPAAIKAAIEKGVYIANLTEEDPFAGLAEARLMAYGYPDLDLYHPYLLELEQLIAAAKRYEQHGLAYAPSLLSSDGITISSSAHLDLYANSHGFLGIVPSTSHYLDCSFVAEDDGSCGGDKGQREQDGYWTAARCELDLEDGMEVAHEAAQRTVSKLGACTIKTCQTPVIFSRDVAVSLIKSFTKAISGYNLYNQSSFLLDTLGSAIFAHNITMIEDPYISRGLGSSPFDHEGVKLAVSPLVSEGRLQRYLLDSYSARKLRLNTTGNSGGIHNLLVTSKEAPSFEQMLKDMGTGLLVTSLMGQGVNLTTGDFSRGASGYWVNNGKIVHPVKGVTIAGNLKDLFAKIILVGNDVCRASNILTGSILVEELVVAGT